MAAVLRRLRALSALRRHRGSRCSAHPNPTENLMGKYFLAWLLGVPGIVLLLVYLFFH